MHLVMWVVSVFPQHYLEMINVIIRVQEKSSEERPRKAMANTRAKRPPSMRTAAEGDVEMDVPGLGSHHA